MGYSYEYLKTVKYADLLKISKSLQLKCGRQKTEKVIQLILANQESLNAVQGDDDAEMLEDVEFPEHSLVSDDETNDTTKNEKKVDKSSDRSTVAVKRKRTSDVSDGSPSTSNISLRRSDTFIVDKQSPEGKGVTLKRKISPPVARRPTLTRSRTFDAEDVESPSKRRRVSDSRVLPIIKSPDLTCSEVMTAADIKAVEESPLNSAVKSAARNFRPKDLTARRSLRGCLLNSRLTGSISSFEAIPSPLIRERTSRGADQSIIKATPVSTEITAAPIKTSSSQSRELRGVGVTKRNTRKFTAEPKQADNETGVKSGIPRFVAYARKLKMPNFSRIHEKNFGKMEAVDDYLERKQNRAGNAQSSFCLSSTKKPGSVFKPSVTSTEGMNLNFTGNLQTSRYTPNKSTVKKSMGKASIAKIVNTSTLSQKSKENVKPVKAKTKLDFTKAPAVVPFKGRNTTELGLRVRTTAATKGPTKPLASQSTSYKAAALAKRVPKPVSNSERRANESSFLKGVRLNKRFELQMAKRGLKLN